MHSITCIHAYSYHLTYNSVKKIRNDYGIHNSYTKEPPHVIARVRLTMFVARVTSNISLRKTI